VTAVYSSMNKYYLLVYGTTNFTYSLNIVRNVVYGGCGKGIIAWYFWSRDGGWGKKQKEGRFLKGPSPCNSDHSRKTNEFAPPSREALCCQCATSLVVACSDARFCLNEQCKAKERCFLKELMSQNSASVEQSYLHIDSLPHVQSNSMIRFITKMYLK